MTPTFAHDNTEYQLRRYSERVYRFLDCSGAIRVDFIVSRNDKIYALEINTSPGVQVKSNLLQAAYRAGLEYDRVIFALLEDALARGNELPWK